MWGGVTGRFYSILNLIGVSFHNSPDTTRASEPDREILHHGNLLDKQALLGTVTQLSELCQAVDYYASFTGLDWCWGELVRSKKKEMRNSPDSAVSGCVECS